MTAKRPVPTFLAISASILSRRRWRGRTDRRRRPWAATARPRRSSTGSGGANPNATALTSSPAPFARFMDPPVPLSSGWTIGSSSPPAEVRDQRIGVLATSPVAIHQAKMFRLLSPHVTLLGHAAPPPAEVYAGVSPSSPAPSPACSATTITHLPCPRRLPRSAWPPPRRSQHRRLRPRHACRDGPQRRHRRPGSLDRSQRH